MKRIDEIKSEVKIFEVIEQPFDDNNEPLECHPVYTMEMNGCELLREDTLETLIDRIRQVY